MLDGADLGSLTRFYDCSLSVNDDMGGEAS